MKKIPIIITAIVSAWLVWSLAIAPAKSKSELRKAGPPPEEPTLVSLYETKTSSLANVDVTVTPRDLSETAAAWEFEIVLETHSVELGMDLVAVSELGADQKTYQPLKWDGDGPGGHHRSGVLTFASITPRPQSITLNIKGVGTDETREFNWEL